MFLGEFGLFGPPRFGGRLALRHVGTGSPLRRRPEVQGLVILLLGHPQHLGLVGVGRGRRGRTAGQRPPGGGRGSRRGRGEGGRAGVGEVMLRAR